AGRGRRFGAVPAQPGRGRQRVRSTARFPVRSGQPPARKPGTRRTDAAFLGDDLAGPADLGPDSGHHPWPLRKAASVTVRIEADWLGHEDLQRLLAILGSAGEEARIAGGAVRNALIGEKV